MSVKILGEGLPLLIRAVQALSKDQVLVGVPADSAPRQNASDPSNATLAYIHEYGAPEANIPARPFLGPGIMDARAAVAEAFKQAGIQALKDTASLRGTQGGSAVEKGLHTAGSIARDAVKAKVERGPFKALSPRTLARRRAKGNAGTRPLLDTEQMYEAITYRVEPKKR